MLLERDETLALLRRRVAETVAGHGGVVLVEGAAGSGKSTLLRAVRDEATDRDVVVRYAIGGELEREFSFGLVRQLLEPVVRRADAEERRRLLSGAAAQAAPIVGAEPATQPGADTPFSTLHGLYWLVAAMSEAAPVLLVVDDAHWSDVRSLEFCDFLARRAEELALLIVLAVRPLEPGAPQALLTGIAEIPRAEVIRTEALGPEAARELLESVTGAEVADDVARAALISTGGNPLLVRELGRTLAGGEGAPTVADVDAAVPSSVARSVQRRVVRLGHPGSEVAEALAILGEGRGGDVLAAVAGQPVEAVPPALDALRAAGLVEGTPPRFVHPLIRQAVASTIPTGRRDALHLAAARVLRDSDGAEDDVVAHLLSTPPIDEPWALHALRDGAARALAEGDSEACVRRLQRVLAVTGPDDEVLLELAYAEIQAGTPAAYEHLRQAADSQAPLVAARAIALQIGTGSVGSPAEFARATARAEQLTAELEAGHDRDLLRISLINAVLIDSTQNARRPDLIASIRDDDPPQLRSQLAWDLATSGAPRSEVEKVTRSVFDTRPFDDPLNIERAVAFWALIADASVDAEPVAGRALAGGEATARRYGSRLARAYYEFMRAYWGVAGGSASVAEAAARESFEFFRQTNDLQTQSVAAMLIVALSQLGRLEEAEAIANSLMPTRELAESFAGVSVLHARAQLRAAQGHHEEALADLELVQAATDRYAWAVFPTPPLAPLLRAGTLSALGRAEEARDLAVAERERARARDVPRDEVHALLVLAGLESDHDERRRLLEAAERRARDSHSGRAQVQAALELGAEMRRRGDRVASRDVLARAREQAHGLDLVVLEARATEELVVAGFRPRRIALSGLASLTPAERRVAERATSGLSNREIAETLFVTRKTVEATLGSVYSKLGIRSRTQLPEALNADARTA